MEFFNATGEAHNQHWSDLSTFGFWNSNEVSAPFPIVLAVERVHYSRVQKGELDTFATYEFTPFELGTWNPPLSSFSELKNIGTPVFNGTVLDRGEKSCVNGFDNVGFVVGTSSAIFSDLFLLTFNSTSDELTEQSEIKIPANRNNTVGILTNSSKQKRSAWDRVLYSPNPFYGFNASQYDP